MDAASKQSSLFGAPSEESPTFFAQAFYWLQLAWLVALPGLAVVSAHLLLPESTAFEWLFLPTLVYMGIILIPGPLALRPSHFRSIWGIVLVLLVPLQVGISTVFFGASALVFLLEVCLIEIGALMIGLALATIRANKPKADFAQIGGLLVVIIVVGLMGAGPLMGLYPALQVGYEGASIWTTVLFATAFATATFRHGRMLWAEAVRSSKANENMASRARAVEPTPKKSSYMWIGAMAWFAFSPWLMLWILASFGVSYTSPAEELLRRCENDQFDACTQLAAMYFEGVDGHDPVKRDVFRAEAIYGHACDSGHQPACARHVLTERRRCATGQAAACFSLADRYTAGTDVAEDVAQALHFFNEGCALEIENPSCMELAAIYEKGGTLDGVVLEPEYAADMYRELCKKNNFEACTRLAAMHMEGREVAQDPARARVLLKKACDGGYQAACEASGGAHSP